MTIVLRGYQEEADAAVAAAHARGVRRPAVVAATGAGKTVMLATRARRHLKQHGGRALVVAHRIELIEQNAQNILDVDPSLNVGIVKANRNETRADVISCSVQTLASERRRQMIADVSLVIIDECHRAAAPSYLALLGHYGAWGEEGGAVAAGYTATMARSDRKALGDIWQEVVYTKDIASLVREGFLVRPRGLRVRVDDLDISKVKKRGGDYDDEQMGAALEQSLAPEAIAKAIHEHAAGRPGILFAPTVHSAGVIADALNDAGITAAVASADTPADVRKGLRAESEAGRVQIVCNVGLFTEGTDWPWISLVVLASPTRSVGTFVQKAGRGLRLYPGKTDCLIMMIGGAAAGHSLMAPVELFGESAEDLERDPCSCVPGVGGGGLLDASCACGRRRCTEWCSCGGGGMDCGCPRSTDDDDLLDEDLGSDLETVLGVDGPLVAHEVDLFMQSDNAWDRTHAGVWFLPAGRERLIVIVPGDPDGRGGWDVVAMNAKPWDPSPWSMWVVRGVSEPGYAMAHAEGEVTLAERRVARKDASWRAGKADLKQRNSLKRMGVVVPLGATNGEVDAMMIKELASSRIDSHIPEYARRTLTNA